MVVGVIRPPPEIRAVADRTALYVAKNGRGFEVRILNSEKGKTPKFAFLQPNSPFHAYYEERIKFYEKGGNDEDPKDETEQPDRKGGKHSTGQPKEEKEAVESTKEKKGKLVVSVGDPVSKAILTQRSKIAKMRSSLKSDTEGKSMEESKEESNVPGITMIPPPPPLYFINIVAPSSLTVAQIEIIQLVAQMTALDGKGGGFLTSLTMREWKNPEFAFCQPRNGLFPYFSALVDAYTRVLALQTSLSEKKSVLPDDATPVLASNVEKCLEMAAYRAEYERDQTEHRGKDGTGVERGALIDWNDFVVVETIDFSVDEKVLTLPPPPPPPPPLAPAGRATAIKTTTAQRQDEMEDDSDDDGEQIRVVPSYTPKVVSSKLPTSEMVIDPITGKSVPVKDMPEHMRIQLLDPKWAEERKKFQEKQKESNLVEGNVVASNLAQFAQARGMGSKDVLSKENAMKRLKDANRVLREQSLHPTRTAHSSLPENPTSTTRPQLEAAKSNHPAPTFNSSVLPPDAKKPRVETPQPPPAIPMTIVKPPPPKESFTGALSNTPNADGASTMASTTTTPVPDSSELLPEAMFAQTLPRPNVTLQVRIPNDPAQMAWNFYGQIVSLSIDVMTKVKAVKQELSRLHLNDMPANKIQLKSTDKGIFLKDSLSLAASNIGPTATLELIPKTRGGRK